MSRFVEDPRLTEGRLIREHLGDFWKLVDNTSKFSVQNQVLMQNISNSLRQLYQVDNDISLPNMFPFDLEEGFIEDVPEDGLFRFEINENIASIPEIHSSITYPKLIYEEGSDYTIILDNGTKYVDFTEGDSPAGFVHPDDVGNREESYIYVPYIFNRSTKIADKFGKLVGVERQDSENYLDLVQGLWYALHYGPSIQNIKIAMNLFIGLPSVQEEGVVTSIGTSTVTVDGSIFNKKILVSTSSSNEIVKIDGIRWRKINISQKIGESAEDGQRLDVVWKNTQNVERPLDSSDWRFDGLNLYIRQSLINEIDDRFQYMFTYTDSRDGTVTNYEIGNIPTDDAIQKNKNVDRFQNIASNIEFRDKFTNPNIWNQKQLPTGLFKVLLFGSSYLEISNTGAIQEFFTFMDRIKPVWTDFQFDLIALPTMLLNIGDARPEFELEDLVRQNAVPLYNRERSAISDLIEQTPERAQDQELDKRTLSVLYWDHLDHPTSQKRDVPQTWGQAKNQQRSWDEFYFQKRPQPQWDNTRGPGNLEELKNILPLYVEGTGSVTPQDDIVADTVKQEEDGLINFSGMVQSVDLQELTFKLQSGQKIIVNDDTVWGEGYHWDEADVETKNVGFHTDFNNDVYEEVDQVYSQSGFVEYENELKDKDQYVVTRPAKRWDAKQMFAVPIWDANDISADREWNETNLEWNSDIHFAKRDFTQDVNWDDYGVFWDIIDIYKVEEL